MIKRNIIIFLLVIFIISNGFAMSFQSFAAIAGGFTLSGLVWDGVEVSEHEYNVNNGLDDSGYPEGPDKTFFMGLLGVLIGGLIWMEEEGLMTKRDPIDFDIKMVKDDVERKDNIFNLYIKDFFTQDSYDFLIQK